MTLASESFWQLLKSVGVEPAIGPPEKQPMTLKRRSINIERLTGEPKEEELDAFAELEIEDKIISSGNKANKDHPWSPEAREVISIVQTGLQNRKTFGAKFIAAHFKTLKLENMKINNLDEGMLLFKNLTELSLANNQLTRLDYIPPSVISLCVNSNHLEEAPAVPDSLRHLGVSHNPVASLYPLIKCKPTKLQSLDLSFNCLEVLSEIRYLRRLKSLKYLHVEGNPVTMIRDAKIRIIQILALTVTHLNGTEITESERASAASYVYTPPPPTETTEPEAAAATTATESQDQQQQQQALLSPTSTSYHHNNSNIAAENIDIIIDISNFKVPNPKPEDTNLEADAANDDYVPPPIRYSFQLKLPFEETPRTCEPLSWKSEMNFAQSYKISLPASTSTRDFIKGQGLSIRVFEHTPLPPPPPPEPTAEELLAQQQQEADAKKKGGKGAAPAAAKADPKKDAPKGKVDPKKGQVKAEVEEVPYDAEKYKSCVFGTLRVDLGLMLQGFEIKESFPIKKYDVRDDYVMMLPNEYERKRRSKKSENAASDSSNNNTNTTNVTKPANSRPISAVNTSDKTLTVRVALNP